MNKSKILRLAVATVLSQCLGVSSGNAQEFYKAHVSVVGLATNENGKLIHRALGNRDFIRKCANEQGVTNLAGLALLYNRTANSLQVVSGTNQVLLCTPLSFGGGVSISNSNQTKVERLESVFANADSLADGTLAATERYDYGTSNTIARFSLKGRLQFALPAEGTNGPVIYTGSLHAH